LPVAAEAARKLALVVPDLGLVAELMLGGRPLSLAAKVMATICRVAPRLRQEAMALLVLMALPSKVAVAQIRDATVNVPQVVVAVAAATSVVVVVATWAIATTVVAVALATRGHSTLTTSTVVLRALVALVVVAQRTQMEVSQSQSCVHS